MLILLDIDGVMVQASSWKPVVILNDGFTAFNGMATKGLQRIISETGASIVLTTSHKDKYSLSQWTEIFKERGITTRIDKLEKNTSFLSRKEEILRWFEKNTPVSNYVIIDDDKSLNGLPPHIKNKLVQTSSTVGLNNESVIAAIEILKNPELISA